MIILPTLFENKDEIEILSPFPKQEHQSLMDWDTYISLNAYGISNLISGLTELIPNKIWSNKKDL
ncbi:hypothetical protein [Spiroplasma endosymbiont of Monopis laevigella]|uniref:hypothetical protein n=1 Tax=Spiroplasma endosymbiont of Monopis laevigella TaxID=3066312 RepID=UPI0030CF697D